MGLASTLLVDDVMRRWPATIRVFLDHRMRCVGCPIACFHTVEDACKEHGTDMDRFLADLARAAGGPVQPGAESGAVVPARWPVR